MAIAMKSWTWSPRVGLRILMGIALGCVQVLFVVSISKQILQNEIGDEELSSKYMEQNFSIASRMRLSVTQFSKGVDDFFEKVKGMDCFIPGTNFQSSEKKGSCVCYKSYRGTDCGIPIKVWDAHMESHYNTVTNEYIRYNWAETLKRRKGNQRRLIHALPVNLELDLFEARIATLYDVVDVFLIGESNMTNSGGSRELSFHRLLQSGWLKPYHDKIVYVFRGLPPPKGFDDGVYADAYMRFHLTRKGLMQLNDVREDDLFLYTDGDELPRPEILQFFKLYDGWPQPVAFQYKWSIYGFFWQVDGKVYGAYSRPIPSMVTIDVLRDIYQNDSSLIRRGLYYKTKEDLKPTVLKYNEKGLPIDQMSVIEAGWHCSWCFKPQGIRAKLLDAPNSDFPRFGDDRARTDVAYIRRLIKHGLYFNLARVRKGDEVDVAKDSEFAPSFMLRYPKKYSHLLSNPYKNLVLPRSHN